MDSKTFVVKILMVKKPSDYSNLLNNTQMLIKFKCAKNNHTLQFQSINHGLISMSHSLFNVMCILNCGFNVI